MLILRVNPMTLTYKICQKKKDKTLKYDNSRNSSNYFLMI